MDPSLPGSLEGEINTAGLGREVSLCDLRSLRTESSVELTTMRAQSVDMDLPVSAAFDAAVTVPTATGGVQLTLG